MKKVVLFTTSLFLVVMFQFVIQAQTAQPQAAPIRIAIIDTSQFDSKDGIKRYLTAMDSLEAEFKPVDAKIQQMATRYQALGAELKKIQDQLNQPGAPPIDQKSVDAKVEEYQTLEKNIKREQEDAKSRLERRQQQVLGPLLREIGQAMQEFATQRGIDIILDASKLDNAGLILALNPAKIDVTKDFITFFNAKPAPTASATPAKTTP